MNIKIKTYDGKLLFSMNDMCLYDELLNDLNKLLESSLFNKRDYYPKAFFDFKSRILNENDIILLLEVLNKNKKVIFNGMNFVTKQYIDIYNKKVRNGESIYVNHKTLFTEIINPGATIYCNDDVYLLNKVKGHIVSYNDKVKIYASCFESGSITICSDIMHNVTFSTLNTVYYKDDKIHYRKENVDEQDNSDYFW